MTFSANITAGLSVVRFERCCAIQMEFEDTPWVGIVNNACGLSWAVTHLMKIRPVQLILQTCSLQ